MGEERIVSATADFDEIHWYTDEKTHERKLSRPELDVRFVPELDGKADTGDAGLFPDSRQLRPEVLCHCWCGECRKIRTASSVKRCLAGQEERVQCILAGIKREV